MKQAWIALALAGCALDGNDAPPVWGRESGAEGVSLRGVWGSGPDDVYAVGDRDGECVVLHSMGDGRWIEQSTRTAGFCTAIWGSGESDIYVGGWLDGSPGILLHSTGDGAWQSISIAAASVDAIWGTGPDDVYVTSSTNDGNVYHSTGAGTFSPLVVGEDGSTITGVWGTSASKVYFTGGTGSDSSTPYAVRGPAASVTQTFPTVDSTTLRHNLFAAWGSSDTDLYAIGNAESVYRSRGDDTWSLETRFHPGPSWVDTLRAIWGSGPEDIYIVGEYTGVYHSTGDGSWSVDAGLQVPDHSAYGIWGTGADDVYVVGDGLIAHLGPPR